MVAKKRIDFMCSCPLDTRKPIDYNCRTLEGKTGSGEVARRSCFEEPTVNATRVGGLGVG